MIKIVEIENEGIDKEHYKTLTKDFYKFKIDLD